MDNKTKNVVKTTKNEMFSRRNGLAMLFILLVLLMIFWDAYEICTYSKNSEMRQTAECVEFCFAEILHKIYGNIAESSLRNASAFCSLFAIVIAMVQTVYPFRLGKIHDYPVSRLNEKPFRQINIKKLIWIAGGIILAELLRFYALEIVLVLSGFKQIASWLYNIVKQYEQYENESEIFTKRIKENLYHILSGEEIEKSDAEEDIREIFERNINIDGVEERKILKQTAAMLADKTQVLPLSIKLSDNQYKSIFEFSIYLSNQLTNKSIEENLIGHSWHYRMLKTALMKADYNMDSGEAFVKGALCGWLTIDNKQAASGFVDEIMPFFFDKLKREQFGELLGCLCVFLELYCYTEVDGYDAVDLLAHSGYLFEMCCCEAEDIEGGMKAFYRHLVDLNFLKKVDDYEVVEELQNDLVYEAGRNIPKTIVGNLCAYYYRT